MAAARSEAGAWLRISKYARPLKRAALEIEVCYEEQMRCSGSMSDQIRTQGAKRTKSGKSPSDGVLAFETTLPLQRLSPGRFIPLNASARLRFFVKYISDALHTFQVRPITDRASDLQDDKLVPARRDLCKF